ncbi:UvrD-helicase domain-containing protein [Patulibacter sp.]|uniref:UvrD-helicase domain-containing protein n=1 Tax=Patulibacter sp. TaxID=1912859 RepID=UPI002719C4B4|nr:UvrD-helicase domain-containing protein [Patulibacter sp.]MDO9410099.1 UvrD-helicase domain-containing protein [Patulibacter sp.]
MTDHGTTAASFDVLGPLPRGVAVLEASAGTGKTFTIAALTARFVAEEGVPLDRLLVVTFTRAATSELRERVRERLTSAERLLTDVLDGTPVPASDELAHHLADVAPDEIRIRRDRLSVAVADFDAATITTTHGFCLAALDGLGFVGDVERGSRFTDDVRDLVDQVVGDLYVRRFHERRDDDPDGDWPPVDHAQAHAIATAAIRNPGADVVPDPAVAEPVAAMRARLAARARDELDRRKRDAAVMTYDDLLVRLDDALQGPAGKGVAARLRERYEVVLVDEFQDTDPVQWQIMDRAFAEAPGGTLVLIGDPKQAIYAFRGADVHAYLRAAETATTHATLSTNWRSDGPLLGALEDLFRTAQLGHERIVFRSVDPADDHREPRLRGAPVEAPLRIRLVDRQAVGLHKGCATAEPSRQAIAEDLAREVVGLLESGAEITAPGGAAEGVRPRDVAVLVRRNADAATVQRALQAAGVPAVIGGAGSVFATPAARHWLALLEALEQPSSPVRARALALTPFLDRTVEQVAGDPDETWEAIHDRLHEWSEILRDHGVAALEQRVTVGEHVAERLLGGPAGERELTDLQHVGQELHVATTTEHLGTSALLGWLRRRVAEADDDPDAERSRRLESDAEAVQVLTIHRSKGLEFPIVLCPYLWHPSYIDRAPHPIAFHDPEDGFVRKLDVGCDPVESAVAIEREEHEVRGEDLRLAYVALTRARHQAVVWWAGTSDSKHSPLSRLAFDQAEDGPVPAAGTGVPADDEAAERFGRLFADRPEVVAVERIDHDATPARWSGGGHDRTTLRAARFTRSIDRTWGRSSFSGIVAGSHDAHPVSGGLVGSEVPEGAEGTVDDEPTDDVGPGGTPGAGPGDGVAAATGGTRSDGEGSPAAAGTASKGAVPATAVDRAGPDGDPGPPAAASALDAPSPMADLPAGRHFGTLVHDVFEAADFVAEDADAELRHHVHDAIARRRLDLPDPERLVSSLRGVLDTPLGPLVGDLPLRRLTQRDRLNELTFELPLAGGSRPAGHVRPAAIGALLREHLDEGDPLLPYAARLEDPSLATSLRGYLTGSIDLALRTRGEDGRDRYAVVDFKTNRLGPRDRPATLRDHGPEQLGEAMRDADYALQGLLYLVALHRYLRWRLPDHDPERDIAGLLYLFVRGMRGADTPRVDGTPTGVFAWHAPGALLEAVSDLFDRGGA